MNYFDKCEKCFGAYTPDQQSELCLQHLMLPSVEVPTRDPGPCERYLNTNHEDCCCCQYYDRNVRSELETVEDGEIDYCCEKRNKSIHNIDFSKNCSQTLVINNNSLSFKQKLQRFENGNFDFNLSDSDDASCRKIYGHIQCPCCPRLSSWEHHKEELVRHRHDEGNAMIDLNVTTQNVDVLLTSARFFNKDEVVDQCKDMLTKCDVESALHHRYLSEKHHLHDTTSTLRDFILKNFTAVVDTDSFLGLDVKQLCEILSDDRLNISSEVEVFQAAVNWIKHCRHLRVKRAGEIMRCVRFADITPDDMLKYVEPNINLIDCPDVRNMLLNFYRVHALGKKSVDKQSGLDIDVTTMWRPFRTSKSTNHESLVSVKDVSGMAPNCKKTATLRSVDLDGDEPFFSGLVKNDKISDVIMRGDSSPPFPPIPITTNMDVDKRTPTGESEHIHNEHIHNEHIHNEHIHNEHIYNEHIRNKISEFQSADILSRKLHEIPTRFVINNYVPPIVDNVNDESIHVSNIIEDDKVNEEFPLPRQGSLFLAADTNPKLVNEMSLAHELSAAILGEDSPSNHVNGRIAVTPFITAALKVDRCKITGNVVIDKAIDMSSNDVVLFGETNPTMATGDDSIGDCRCNKDSKGSSLNKLNIALINNGNGRNTELGSSSCVDKRSNQVKEIERFPQQLVGLNAVNVCLSRSGITPISQSGNPPLSRSGTPPLPQDAVMACISQEAQAAKVSVRNAGAQASFMSVCLASAVTLTTVATQTSMHGRKYPSNGASRETVFELDENDVVTEGSSYAMESRKRGSLKYVRNSGVGDLVNVENSDISLGKQNGDIFKNGRNDLSSTVEPLEFNHSMTKLKNCSCDFPMAHRTLMVNDSRVSGREVDEGGTRRLFSGNNTEQTLHDVYVGVKETLDTPTVTVPSSNKTPTNDTPTNDTSTGSNNPVLSRHVCTVDRQPSLKETKKCKHQVSNLKISQTQSLTASNGFVNGVNDRQHFAGHFPQEQVEKDGFPIHKECTECLLVRSVEDLHECTQGKVFQNDKELRVDKENGSLMTCTWLTSGRNIVNSRCGGLGFRDDDHTLRNRQIVSPEACRETSEAESQPEPVNSLSTMPFSVVDKVSDLHDILDEHHSFCDQCAICHDVLLYTLPTSCSDCQDTESTCWIRATFQDEPLLNNGVRESIKQDVYRSSTKHNTYISEFSNERSSIDVQSSGCQCVCHYQETCVSVQLTDTACQVSLANDYQQCDKVSHTETPSPLSPSISRRPVQCMKNKADYVRIWLDNCKETKLSIGYKEEPSSKLIIYNEQQNGGSQPINVKRRSAIKSSLVRCSSAVIPSHPLVEEETARSKRNMALTRTTGIECAKIRLSKQEKRVLNGNSLKICNIQCPTAVVSVENFSNVAVKFLATGERYDTVTDKWSPIANMADALVGCAVTSFHGLLWLIGGYQETPDGIQLIFPSVDCYHPENDSWSTKRALPRPVCHASAAVVTDRLFLVGGAVAEFGHQTVVSRPDVLQYVDDGDYWTRYCSLLSPRHDMGCCVVGPRLYVIGGVCSGIGLVMKDVECLDVSQPGTWSRNVKALATPTLGLTCVTVNS